MLVTNDHLKLLLDQHGLVLDQILAEARRTNGRLTALEVDRERREERDQVLAEVAQQRGVSRRDLWAAVGVASVTVSGAIGIVIAILKP